MNDIPTIFYVICHLLFVLINIIFDILISLIAIKALLIGSDFSFTNWIKYGKKYTNWYFNRPKFNPDLIENITKKES